MEKVFTRLQQLVAEVPGQLALFSVEEMTLRPTPNKWSKREILGHLCDSALHNWQRFVYAQAADGPLEIKPYPQVDLVKLNHYQHLPTGQTAALWASLNMQIVAVIKNLPEEKLSHPVHLPTGAPAYSAANAGTLRWLIEDYLVHLEHHLRQIFPAENIAVPILPDNWLMNADAALSALSNHPDGKPFLSLLEDKKMYVEIYAPLNIDRQKPHGQDEIYVVIHGSGIFFNNGHRRPFGPGDLIFVPAGTEHRFEDFSDDFSTWVIFY